MPIPLSRPPVVALLLALGLAACSGGEDHPDSGSTPVDSGSGMEDAGPGEDGGVDAGMEADAGIDAGLEDGGQDGGFDAGHDAGPRDAGHCPSDAGMAADAGFCLMPVANASGCNNLAQHGSLIDELQVADDPPAATGGWYPAGDFVLTAATLYTGPCGPSGPSGRRYSASLEVRADMQNPSIDHYRVVQSQTGCPAVTYNFAGDTFGAGPPPWDHLNNVSWMCPSCPSCSSTMKYSGSAPLPDGGMDFTHGTFTYFVPLENGQTLALEFTE